MHKRTRQYGFHPLVMGAAVMLFLLIAAVPVSAQNPPPFPELKDTIVVKIYAKDKDAVFVNERRFLITDKTVILNMADQIIDLTEFIVPCKAEITYRLKPLEPDPECLQIVVKSIFINRD